MSDTPTVLELNYRDGTKTSRPMTPEELAQRELDIAEAAEQRRKQRAIISREEFIKRAEDLGVADAVWDSKDSDVKKIVRRVYAVPNVNLLSDEAIGSVRQILQVKGRDDGSAILTSEQGDALLAIPEE